MERLKLKKVIYLSPDDPDPVFLSFLEDQGIKLVRLGMNESSFHSSWNSISEETVLEALKIILGRSLRVFMVKRHLKCVIQTRGITPSMLWTT